MKPSVLYISYDGMMEPLGQSQVLAYLEHLSGEYDITLLSFEKPEDTRDSDRLQAIGTRISAASIRWKKLRYHRRPSGPATAYDILRGTVMGIYLARRHGVRIIHARSYVAAVMALAIKRIGGARFLFDMRGFWADERVDGGLWPRGSMIYRISKAFEKRFFLAADAVVSLTEAGAREIRRFDYLEDSMPPITIIPTCADLELFRPDGAQNLEPFTLGYVGSVGTWYLFDEFLAFFKTLKDVRPDAKLLIVNRNEHEVIAKQIAEAGIAPADVEVVKADHRAMPAFIARMTAGTALIKPVYSKIASAPTKLAEFLGCGIPCLGNSEVGDMAEILEDDNVGVVLRTFDEAARVDAVDKLIALTKDPMLSDRCVETAQKRFSLRQGVADYRRVYETMLGV